MDPQAQPQSAAILRLSSDIWTLLSECLESGDVFRLITTGNRALADRLRIGARTLKVRHVGTRYIELDRVFELASSFRKLSHLEITEPRHRVRCWTPISWNLLSCRLTSLSLSFVGALGFVLRDGVSGSTWPELLNLSLEDKLSELEHPEFGAEPLTQIDLRGLPPALQHLRVRSLRKVIFDPSHLNELPSTLETLNLNFKPCFDAETPLNEHGRFVFPSLPPNLKKLKFVDAEYAYWDVAGATLPASLELLKFRVSHLVACHREVPTHECSRFNFEGMAAKMPHLVELNVRDVLISVAEAIRLVPSSVTRLSISFNESTTQDAELVVQHFGHLLFEHYTEWKALDEIISNGKNDLPLLKMINNRIPHHGTIEIFPEHVEELEIPHSFYGQVPLSVVSLKVWTDWGEPHDEVYVTPYHTNLTSFTLSYPMKMEWIERLPITLQKLTAELTDEVFVELLRVMSDTDRLSSLRTLKLLHTTDMDLDCFLSRPLPPQLTRLKILLNSDRFGERLNEAHLLNLRSSTHLDRLAITSKHQPWRNPIGFFDLLNNLPSKLKSLKLETYYVPSPQWPVILPATLTNLDIVNTNESDGVAALENWLGDLDERGELLLTPPFKLPASLTRYCCQKPVNKQLPLECLPPYLSQLNIGDTNLCNQYFASRVPPSPTMKLDVPEYVDIDDDATR